VIKESLSRLLQQIYPQLDSDALTDRVIETFWPQTQPAESAKAADNSQWSQQDSILISYGDSLLDGRHNPLDLLHDFLDTQLSGVINGVHILPFFPYTSDDGFSISDYEKVNPSLGSWADIQRIASNFNLMSDLVLNHVSSQGKWFNGTIRSILISKTLRF